MAVTYTGTSRGGYVYDMQGLSTDTKPTSGIASGSTFWDIDTSTGWVYDANNVNPATSNGWWQM